MKMWFDLEGFSDVYFTSLTTTNARQREDFICVANHAGRTSEGNQPGIRGNTNHVLGDYEFRTTRVGALNDGPTEKWKFLLLCKIYYFKNNLGHQWISSHCRNDASEFHFSTYVAYCTFYISSYWKIWFDLKIERALSLLGICKRTIRVGFWYALCLACGIQMIRSHRAEEMVYGKHLFTR